MHLKNEVSSLSSFKILFVSRIFPHILIRHDNKRMLDVAHVWSTEFQQPAIRQGWSYFFLTKWVFRGPFRRARWADHWKTKIQKHMFFLCWLEFAGSGSAPGCATPASGSCCWGVCRPRHARLSSGESLRGGAAWHRGVLWKEKDEERWGKGGDESGGLQLWGWGAVRRQIQRGR